MKKIHSPYQQEFEPVRKIQVVVEEDSKAADAIRAIKMVKDSVVVEAVLLEEHYVEPTKWEPRVRTAEEDYTQKVSRNVEIMGDLIWRYSPSDEMAEKLKNGMNAHWLDLMDRMKRICQLCDLEVLNYSGVYQLDPIKQKIIQRELEVIRGRYKLEEWSKGFVILEDWYVRGNGHI